MRENMWIKRKRLAHCNTSSKDGSVAQSKWKKSNNKKKSDVCANRFYTNIEH